MTTISANFLAYRKENLVTSFLVPRLSSIIVQIEKSPNQKRIVTPKTNKILVVGQSLFGPANQRKQKSVDFFKKQLRTIYWNTLLLSSWK